MGDLLDDLAKPTRPAVAFAAGPTNRTDAEPYALAALADEVRNLLAVPIGSGRNHQLNVSAFKMGQLVAAGVITEQQVTETLGQADGGLDYKATRGTIASGLRDGMRTPRAIPERTHHEWSTSAAPDIASLLSDDPLEPGVAERIGSALTSTTSTPNSTTRSPNNADWPTTDTSTTSSTAQAQAAPPASSDSSAISPTLSELVHERLPLVDWFKLWNADTREEWIVEPILPARRQIAIYSAPKVGKSLLLLEVAVAVCQGTEVLGAKVSRPYRVLYVDFENDPEGDIRQRLINMGAEPMGLDNLCYLSYPSMSSLDSAQGAADLVAAVQVYRCEVVVIDTISRAIGGEENENDTWLKFYRHTGLEMKRLGVAMIRLDHSGKNEAAGMRGGSAKYGDVDAVWKMTRLTEGGDGEPESFRLVCEASRFQINANEKLLTFRRIEGPLRHVVKPTGSGDLIIHAIKAYLDDNEGDTAWSYSTDLLAAIRSGGVPGAAQATLKTAIREWKAARKDD